MLSLQCVVLLSLGAPAQHGTAPSGYYPAGYSGDIFTGTVVSVDQSSDAVTLEYSKGGKSEKLVVIMEGGCKVPSKGGEPMHAKNIPEGTVLTAFYMPKTEKINGEKQKLHVFVAISFVEWQGKKIATENQKVWSCGTDVYKQFRPN